MCVPHRTPAAAQDLPSESECHKPNSNQKAHLWPHALPTARSQRLSSPRPHRQPPRQEKALERADKSFFGGFGVQAAEGCCLQGQSSPHDGGDGRQLRDGCWVLLLSSVGLPSPVQAPQPRSRSPSLPNTQGQSCSISTGGIKTTKQPEISLRRRDAKRATVTAV